MNITSLVLWVQDATLSAKFYKKVGFEIVRVTEESATVKCGEFELTLVTMRDEDEFRRDSFASDKGKGMYIYVHVDNIDEKYNQLVKVESTPNAAPRDWPWGNREFVVKDPDGYKLCFWDKIP